MKKMKYLFLMQEWTHILLTFVFVQFFFLFKVYLYSALPDDTGGSVLSKFVHVFLFHLLPRMVELFRARA